MGLLDYQHIDGKSDTKSRLQRLRAFYRGIRALSLISLLARARDYSLRSMTGCSGLASYVDIVAAPGVAVAVPMSHSSSYRDHDNNYRELIRAASQRERAPTTPTRRTALSDDQPLPRSFSTPTGHYQQQQQLGVGRIDEESPCYFSASFKKAADEDLFLRSRSCSAVQNMNLQGRRNANAV